MQRARLPSALSQLRQSFCLLSASTPQPCTLASASTTTSIRRHSTAAPTGRPRLVVVGSGWAASSLAKDIDTTKYNLTVCRVQNTLCSTLREPIKGLEALNMILAGFVKSEPPRLYAHVARRSVSTSARSTATNVAVMQDSER